MVAAATPLLLTALFGAEFADAAEPAWVLLAAGVPLSGAAILGPTLNGVGRPGLPAVGQALALLITVPGLLLLLPSIGIMGAAVVSLVAYTANFLVLFVATIRIFDTTARDLLVPKRSDLAWLWGFIRERLPFWGAWLSSPRRSGYTESSRSPLLGSGGARLVGSLG